MGPDGVVTFAWQLPDVAASSVKPEGCFIRIERRQAGGPWEVLESGLISKAMKYQDTKTHPKTTYEYKITLGVLDPAWTPSSLGRLTDRIGGPIVVRTPGIWSIEFSNIQTFEDDTGEKLKPGQAYVIIRKYDQDHGLVEWRKIQHEGEELGVITENGVAELKHKAVTKDGKQVLVDFRVGGKIRKITSGKLVLYAYQECNRQLDRAGAWVCDGPVKKSASYKVHEVLYADEDNRDQDFTKPDGPGPIADKLCPDHGGPPPPRELSADERRALREADAAKLMDEADTLWVSDKPADRKKAQDVYKKLLASFIDLESVKSRKRELVERSKKKID